MPKRHYTIEATRIDRPISPLGKEFYNAHGVAYKVKEEGILSS